MFGDLQLILSAVNQELGYPFASTNVGGGRHAPEEVSMTRDHFEILYDPELDEYYCDIDAKAEELAGKSVDVDGVTVVLDFSNS